MWHVVRLFFYCQDYYSPSAGLLFVHSRDLFTRGWSWNRTFSICEAPSLIDILWYYTLARTLSSGCFDLLCCSLIYTLWRPCVLLSHTLLYLISDLVILLFYKKSVF